MHSNHKMFSPDQRNLGGRRLILQQMLQHVNHIESAKSTINIQTPTLRRTPSPIYDQYKQVLNTFEKVCKISKRPSVEKFKNTYFVKQVSQKNIEHEKNLQKCKERIEHMNKHPDKKNKLNYTKDRQKSDKQNQSSNSKQSQSSQKDQRQKRTDVSMDIPWEQIAKEIPKIGDPKKFKKHIKDLLVKYRITSDDDYAFMICLIQSVNLSVDQQSIIVLFHELLNELELVH